MCKNVRKNLFLSSPQVATEKKDFYGRARAQKIVHFDVQNLTISIA